MQAKHQLRVFTFVTQTEILLVWIIYSVLVGLLLMIPLDNYVAYLAGGCWIILGLTFFQYGFTIIEFTARGYSDVPRMRADIFTSDSRIYKELLVLTTAASLIYAIPNELYFHVAVSCVMLVTPAITAFIALHYSLAQAINPINIWRFMTNMGFTYAALRLLVAWVALTLGYLAFRGTDLFDSRASLFLVSATGTYLLLVMFRGTGALLHLRRQKLGLHTEFSQEQVDEKWQQQQQEKRDRFIVELHKLSRADRLNEAWARLNRAMKRTRYAEDEVYYLELRRMEDPRLLRKMAQGYIGRLLTTNASQSWQIFTTIWEETDGHYRLDSGKTVIGLAATASSRQERQTALILIDQFDEHFPKHPRAREAFLMATQICCDQGDLSRARVHFRKVTSRRGRINPDKYEIYKKLLI